MPTAKVGDINIYYEIHGKGEPFVLIHGGGGSTSQWYRTIPALSKEYRVVVFDIRGSGQSDKPDIPYTMEMMADDLAGLLTEINIDSAHIFGTSMGGYIAQHFALRHPKRVTSLVLGCTASGIGPHSVMQDSNTPEAAKEQIRLQALNGVLEKRWPMQKAAIVMGVSERQGWRIMAAYRKEGATPEAPEQIQKPTREQRLLEALSLAVNQEFIDKNPALIREWMAQMNHPTPPHAHQRQGQAVLGSDTYERLPEIRVPTMVIAGDADRVLPVENSRILASRIPGAELVILKGMGHAFILESEEETNRIILDFLKRNHRSG